VAGLPVSREQFANLAAGHGGQALQNIGEVFLWVNTIATAALDEGVDDGAPPNGIRMPNEQPSLFPDGRRSYVVFYAEMPVMPRSHRKRYPIAIGVRVYAVGSSALSNRFKEGQ
jgi:hypothetical protein